MIQLFADSQNSAVFFRSLGTMFEAGVPLHRALDNLTQQASSPAYQKAAQSISNSLQIGKSLNRAMAEHPRLFTSLHLRVIQSGEVSGKLGHVLLGLATYEERNLSLSRQVKGSLVTPVLVSLVCLALVFVLPPLCLKGMLLMLNESGVALPWPTLVLLQLSQWLSSPWFYLGATSGLVGLTGLLQTASQRPKARLAIWGGLLNLPMVGPLLRVFAVARFAQTLASMLESGNNLLLSVSLAGQTSGNPILESSIDKALEALREGESLARSLAITEFFPQSFLSTLVAGEESGSLVSLLHELVKLLEMDLRHRLEVFTSALEPMMMMVVGGIVGFVSLAALLPMLKVVESL